LSFITDLHGKRNSKTRIFSTNKARVDNRTSPIFLQALLPYDPSIVRRQLDSHPDEDHIFLNDEGTPYTAGVYRRRLERWCKKAKIPVKPPYALRHSFASLQADENTNIVALGQLMGHTSTRTTARYIRASAEHQRQAVDRTAAHILTLLPKKDPCALPSQKMESN
jgi:integrase